VLIVIGFMILNIEVREQMPEDREQKIEIREQRSEVRK
jgi:hypothetical protein